MKLVFKNLASRTDKDKAVPVLDHLFTPLESAPEIKVKCRYLKTGESLKFMTTGAEGRASLDFRALFLSQVTGIEGLEAEYHDGKTVKVDTAEIFLEQPASAELQAILTNTCTHLLNADSLTEDEVKN